MNCDFEILVALSFSVFLLLFIGVGIYSGFSQQQTTEDYLLASREANPWLTRHLQAMKRSLEGDFRDLLPRET